MTLSLRVFQNVQDAFVLGPSFPLRHVAALLGMPSYRVNARHIGKIELRTHSSDAVTFRQAFVGREYALPDAHQARVDARYRELLKQGQRPLILDAGANVGAASRWFAKLYPEALVVAVEPDPANLEMLRKNTADLQQVRVVAAGLGGTEGSVTVLQNAVEGGWAVRTKRAEVCAVPAMAEPVPLVTVNQLSQQHTGSLFLAKIDIEGFEADLFRENLSWLDSLACLFVEPHDWLLPDERTSQTMQEALLGRGFDLLIVGENLAFVR